MYCVCEQACCSLAKVTLIALDPHTLYTLESLVKAQDIHRHHVESELSAFQDVTLMTVCVCFLYE